MTVVKRGAVDVEQKVELGETESAHHANLDHHQGGSENVAQAQPVEPVGAPAAPAAPASPVVVVFGRRVLRGCRSVRWEFVQ